MREIDRANASRCAELRSIFIIIYNILYYIDRRIAIYIIYNKYIIILYIYIYRLIIILSLCLLLYVYHLRFEIERDNASSCAELQLIFHMWHCYYMILYSVYHLIYTIYYYHYYYRAHRTFIIIIIIISYYSNPCWYHIILIDNVG